MGKHAPRKELGERQGRVCVNKFGLYDMSGNVRQWCEDRDHQGTNQRVLRGSSWFDSIVFYLVSWNRFRDEPDSRYSDNGFRCVVASGSSQ
jgi:formylglycine-generating enzyme required for sulfatase activity